MPDSARSTPTSARSTGRWAPKSRTSSSFWRTTACRRSSPRCRSAEKKIRVTYHDPCHLRTQGITKEPRRILAALPQVEFVEMANAGTCCGLGGTYSVYHYETSKQIGAKKAAAIAASGAALVATDCPGCIMQLQDSINHAGGRQRAVHILELLNDVLP